MMVDILFCFSESIIKTLYILNCAEKAGFKYMLLCCWKWNMNIPCFNPPTYKCYEIFINFLFWYWEDKLEFNSPLKVKYYVHL